MSDTPTPKVHCSASAAKVDVDPPTRHTSIETTAVNSPQAAIIQSDPPSETAALCSTETDIDSLFGEESDKEDAGFVSSPPSSVDNAPSSPDTSNKRKASEDAASSADEASSAKKAKLSLPSPPASPPPTDISDLLFPNEASAPPPPAIPAPPAPKKPVARRKKPMANPIRSDIRMGVRGSAAAGAATRHRAPATRPTPKPTQPTPQPPTTAPSPPTQDPALFVLLTANAKAASSRRAVNLLANSHFDAHTLSALAQADKSKGAVKMGASKPVPAWRRDNEDLADVDAALRGTARRNQVLKRSTVGLAAGARRLVQMGNQTVRGGRAMDSTTWEWRVDKEGEVVMERERERWVGERVREVRGKEERRVERERGLEERAGRVRGERERCAREGREGRERRRERIGDGLDELFLEEGL